jgi:hypothetical protein
MKRYFYKHYNNVFYIGIMKNPNQLFFDLGFYSFGWSK